MGIATGALPFILQEGTALPWRGTALTLGRQEIGFGAAALAQAAAACRYALREGEADAAPLSDRQLFHRLGFEALHVMDVNAYEGADLLLDLNTRELPPEHLGRFDLILFGNESADSGGYQVGVRVAHALGRPTVTGIKGIEVEQGTVRLRRDTATGSELYRLPLPAVVSVKEGINLPRYPTLKGRLEAKKAEVRVVEKERVGSGQTMLRLVGPSQVASETTILPDAAAVVDLLEQLQVVR